MPNLSYHFIRSIIDDRLRRACVGTGEFFKLEFFKFQFFLVELQLFVQFLQLVKQFQRCDRA